MIDEEFKQQLLDTLKVAVSHVNAGADSNTAVVKAATAADFNREQTCRLCEVFNTARTIYHFENNPAQKTAQFELVDKDEVLKAAFDDTVKQAASEIYTAPLLSDYAEYEGRELDARHGKLAEALPLTSIPTLDVPNVEDQSVRLMRIVRTQEKLAVHAEAESRYALEHARQAIIKLAERLTSEYWNHGNTKYARLIRCYDNQPEYGPVLAAVKSHMPKYMHCADADLAKLGRVINDMDLTNAKAILAETKEAMEGAAGLAAYGRQMAKEAAEARGQFEALLQPDQAPAGDFDDILTENFKQGQVVVRTTTPSYSVGQLLSGEDPGEATVTKTTPTISQAFQSAVDSTKNVNLGMDAVLGNEEADFNKKITARLRNQQREVLLQDLLINDPFIAESDPNTVAAVYSQIMQIAPEVSLNKEVVRAVLRQGLHNVTAVSPFDASAWADLEKTIREVQGTLPERKVAPKPGGSR